MALEMERGGFIEGEGEMGASCVRRGVARRSLGSFRGVEWLGACICSALNPWRGINVGREYFAFLLLLFYRQWVFSFSDTRLLANHRVCKIGKGHSLNEIPITIV